MGLLFCFGSGGEKVVLGRGQIVDLGFDAAEGFSVALVLMLFVALVEESVSCYNVPHRLLNYNAISENHEVRVSSKRSVEAAADTLRESMTEKGWVSGHLLCMATV